MRTRMIPIHDTRTLHLMRAVDVQTWPSAVCAARRRVVDSTLVGYKCTEEDIKYVNAAQRYA